MKTTLEVLQEKAMRIPSKDIQEDVDTLRKLLIQGKIYFDFCFSRFQLLADHPEAIKEMKEIIEVGNDKNIYLPFLGILLQKLEKYEISSFIAGLLNSDKASVVASYILINTNTNSFIKDLCTLLFNNIPEEEHVSVRDNMLFRFIGLGGSTDFVINCMAKIPTTLNYVFLQEFILFFTYLTQTSGCTSQKLLNLAIDVAINSDDPDTLLEIIANSDFVVPKAFVDWIEQNIQDPPMFPEDRVKNVPIKDLPVMLRIQMLRPAPSAMNTPRFCRAVKQSGGLFAEFQKRVLEEQDPSLLHDLLVAKPTEIMLTKNIPIKFTLLALAAIKDPNLTPTFIGEFCTVKRDDPEEIIKAACAGLAILSERNPVCVTNVFPHIRMLLEEECPGYDYLMKALENAVGSGCLHPQFIWRDYKCLLTVTEDVIEKEPNMIHHCLVGLHDPRYSEISEEILLEMARTDRSTIEKAVLQIQPDILIKHKNLYKLRPEFFEKPNLKTDTLPVLVGHEMRKEKTTQRMLWIATAFGTYPDAFFNFKVPEWAKPIVQAGNDVFNMKQTLDLNKLENGFNFTKTKDAVSRFGSMFALAMLMSHKLVNPSQVLPKVLTAANEDPSPLVRLISLYGLSMCRVANPKSIIVKVLKNKSSTQEDIIGVSYCVTSWATQFPQLFTNTNHVSKIPFFWSHLAEASKLLLRPLSINAEDLLGLAEYIHLTPLEEKTDTLIDILIEKTITPELFATALFGYIPSLAFSLTPFEMSESQRKIYTAGNGEEFDLLSTLITRPKKPQNSPEKKMETQTAMTSIRKNYATIDYEEMSLLISGLSDNMVKELMEDNGPHSLKVAVHVKNIKQVGRLIALNKWEDVYMIEAAKRLVDNVEDVLIEILNNTTDATNAAVFLAFVNFGERISDSNALALLPWMVSRLEITTEILTALSKTNAPMKDIAHATMLTSPNIFTAANYEFNLFE